jgi:L-asparaginase/Glu-tRNA(Gln) amidotransferase subunit D
LNPAVVNGIISRKIDALILESFGPGNVPNEENSLLPSIAKAQAQGIPVLVSTQCIYGATRMYLYEIGTRTLQLGIIPARDMTPEATYVKLLWALAQTKDRKKLADIFSKNIAGEVTIGS